MTRVLVTGAGGFVGSHVVRHLLTETDWHVVGLDSFRHRGLTDRLRVQLDGLDASRLTVLTHDLRAPISTQLDAALGSVEHVLHLASESHVDRSITSPRDFIENNVAVTLTMLEWLRGRCSAPAACPTHGRPNCDRCLHGAEARGIKKFVQISTDEVYGPAYGSHRHAEGEPHRPSNPYSASKAAQEDLCFAYWRTYGLPIMISNTMNIIGEMQDAEKFLPMIIKRTLAGESMVLHGTADGHTGSRFYLHARNQADALLFLLREVHPYRYDEVRLVRSDGGVDRGPRDIPRYHVVGEREISNYDLWQLVSGYTCARTTAPIPTSPQVVDFHSSRPGHDLRYALDGTRLADLGWKPPVPLEDSIRQTVAWTLAHREWLT